MVDSAPVGVAGAAVGALVAFGCMRYLSEPQKPLLVPVPAEPETAKSNLSAAAASPAGRFHRERFAGKVCVVTGAASGLGLATASQLLAEGAKVVLSDVDPAALEAVVKELASRARRGHTGDAAWKSPVIGKVADVSKRADAEAVVAAAEANFGRLDVLVNSAGITARHVKAGADFEERWDRVVAVNVKGTMLMSHAAVEAFRRRKGHTQLNLAVWTS